VSGIDREPSGFAAFIGHSPDGLRRSANKVSAIYRTAADTQTDTDSHSLWTRDKSYTDLRPGASSKPIVGLSRSRFLLLKKEKRNEFDDTPDDTPDDAADCQPTGVEVA